MTHLFDDLEAKFRSLDTKIAEKKVFVENLCTDQQDLLREHFDEDTLKKKYSAEFNRWREGLLEMIRANLKSDMDHIDELVQSNGDYASLKIYLDEWKKTRRLNFNRGVIRSEMACNWRLIVKEFKFGCKFSASQIIKCKHVLGISDYLVQKDGICDWDKSLFEASFRNSNIEIVRLMIDGGANVNGKDEYNSTALILASRESYFEKMKFLVENGADVNEKNVVWTYSIKFCY